MYHVVHDGLVHGSELCALDRQDVIKTASSFILHIHKSKSNKSGPRKEVIIPNYGQGSAYHVLDTFLTQ